MFNPFENLGLKNEIQLVVSAPPYISSKKVKQMPSEISGHEPQKAFDAGPFGLDIFFKLIANVVQYLQSEGFLIFECGLGQGEFLIKRIRSNENYKNIKGVKDINGNIRVVVAQKV